MRIALVILHADPARGGAERYTIDLAQALSGRGHEVSLLAASFASSWPGVANVPLANRGLTRAGRYQRFLESLDQSIDRAKYDIVHAMLPVRRCDVYHPHAGIAVDAAEKWNFVLNPRRIAMANVERRLLTGARPPVTIALSEYVKRSIRAQYPTGRIATLFNAVALDHFDPAAPNQRRETREGRGLSEEDVAGIIVAQDFARKGVPQAIEATRRINAGRAPGTRPLKLLVVGAEHAPGIEGDILFVGSTSRMARFYAASDFFVLPTRHDPCSLVVLEALAMGLPVISTVFNGACEIMTDGVHGRVLNDPRDVDSLVSAMRQLMDDKTRRAMSQACIELRPRLSYDHHLEELMKIYHAAAGRDADPAVSDA